MHSLTGFLSTVSLTLLLAGCADSTGPLPTDNTVDQAQVTGVAYARNGRTTTAPTLTLVAFAANATGLTTFDTTLVFKQGKSGVHKIRIKGNGADADTVTFMRLTIPKFAQFVDSSGEPLPDGSSVSLTVHVDRQSLSVQCSPIGSRITKKPAVLQLNFGQSPRAGGDASNLVVWYQPDPNSPWRPSAATVDLNGKRLTIDLDPLCNYAVAY